VIYVRMVGGEPHPRTWQEYEALVVRSTEDPNVVIALRPGAWQEYEGQFLRGIEDPNDGFEGSDVLDDMFCLKRNQFSGPFFC